MSIGMNLAITYEEIAAYQASTGVSTYAASDERTETGGFYVLWNPDNDQGYTDTGWRYTNGAFEYPSPAYGMTWEKFQADLADGSLNTTFAGWSTRVSDLNDRLSWVIALPDGCKENA